MALLFSHVRVSAPDGNEAEFLVKGIPRDYDDLENYINASNEEYLRRHPYAEREYYFLSNFDMRDVEIVEQIEDEGLDLSM